MKAAQHREHGDLDVLEITEVPDPEVGPGDVLIAVTATTLNRLDIEQRTGPPLLPMFSLPHIAGLDVVGEVVEVGSEVDSVAVGGRVVVNPALPDQGNPAALVQDHGFESEVVVGGNRPGGYAELCAVPATHVYPIPDGFDDAAAAVIPTVHSTAWHALVTVGKVRIGETIMIHAAASGLSTAAIQLAKRIGARVVATAGSERKLEAARALGADHTVNNRSGDVIAAAKEATDGKGVDVVFDHVGPELFQQSLFALRPRGRLLFCGTTTGVEASFNLPYAYHFGMQLIGVDPYSYSEFEEMLDYYWTAKLDPMIDSVFSLDDIREAQRKMEEGDVIGKVVIRP